MNDPEKLASLLSLMSDRIVNIDKNVGHLIDLAGKQGGRILTVAEWQSTDTKHLALVGEAVLTLIKQRQEKPAKKSAFKPETAMKLLTALAELGEKVIK